MLKANIEYKVDLNRMVIGIDGKDSKTHLGEIVADTIASLGNEHCKGGPKVGKLMDWARQLFNHQPIKLDRTDFDSLREFCSLLPRLNLLALDQVDTIFREAKAAAEDLPITTEAK